MRASTHHGHSQSESNNHRAQLAKAYQELCKELSSSKLRVVGNYTLGKVIGEGAYGKVRIGTHRLTGTRVAIKQIPKEVSAQLAREIHHHRRLHHPHVTQLYEVIATETSIWLITELCSGGELYDYLEEKSRLSEEETRRLIGQLCLALHYVHSNGAVHRDLKLENVLLDDRCNVKIGDFGFTREYEQGRLLDTYCGTTGYAAPEMLLGDKYSGPEVDIWSLGIVLYTLLVGSLPFDDDDENVMKAKIIEGEFGTPDFISENAQDLIRSILKRKPSDRPSISGILRHPWFTRPELPQRLPSPPLFTLDVEESLPLEKPIVGPPESAEVPAISDASESSSSVSDAAYYSATSDVASSDLTNITTPDLQSSPPSLPASNQEFRPVSDTDTIKIERTSSQSTIGVHRGPAESSKRDGEPFAAVPEEVDLNPPNPPSRAGSNRSKSSVPPSSFSTRTPVRTKRRSITSNISPPTSPTEEARPLTESPTLPNYAALISATAPIMFSTQLERRLLNSLSALGFDTGQIVHSVLSNACDASGAIWWLLKKKAERREIQDTKRVAKERRKTLEALDRSSERASEMENAASAPVPTDGSFDTSVEKAQPPIAPYPVLLSSAFGPSPSPSPPPVIKGPTPPRVADSPQQVVLPPHISFVPATPTHNSTDSERARSGTVTPNSSVAMLLSAEELSNKSTPASPSASKEKRGSKSRSGSVSMLQRGLGLVRKKSEEKVKEKEREREKEKEREREKEEIAHNRPSESAASGSRSSHAFPSLSHTASFPSGSNKLLKGSPGVSKKHEKDADDPLKISSVLTPDSPYVATTTPPPLLNRPSFKFIPSMSSSPFLSTHDEHRATNVFNDTRDSPQSRNKGRGQRTSILNTVKTWFQEDKKKWRNKAKPVELSLNVNDGAGVPYLAGIAPTPPASARPNQANTFRGRKKIGIRRHDKRPSVSSRRSSSVNSRRSSVHSVQQMRGTDFTGVPVFANELTASVTRERSTRSRRSIGSRTPTSEVGSRPSSIRSFSVGSMPRPGHRPRTPSQSSVASSRARRADRLERTDSPLQQFHRRTGSGPSRVMRQHTHTHRRNDSIASSIASNPRRDSTGELVSEPEQIPSPSPLRKSTSGSSSVIMDPNATPTQRKPHTTLYVAHRQANIFGAPAARNASSLGRMSWKKSWGPEPPGWQSRTATCVVTELETMSDPGHIEAVRDVFHGRQSLDPDDESDWVDEDDDGPTFVGGVGQLPAPTNQPVTLSSPAVTSLLLSSGLPPSPSMRTKRELPPVFSIGLGYRPFGANKSQRARPITSPNYAIPIISEPNPRSPPGVSSTLGVTTGETIARTSPTAPLLPLGSPSVPDREQSPSPETSMGSSARPRRPTPGGRGPFTRGPTIHEEDEEEEG